MLGEMVREYISGLSDADLIEYSLNTDYEPDAITFARQEIDRRKLSPEDVAVLEAEANQRIELRQREIAAAAERPLSKSGKTLAFVSGFIILFGNFPRFLANTKFETKGELRKVREVRRFATYGRIAFAAAVLLLFILMAL
jgi:hypothetical protein